MIKIKIYKPIKPDKRLDLNKRKRELIASFTEEEFQTNPVTRTSMQEALRNIDVLLIN